MRWSNNSSFNNSSLIDLKNQDWMDKQRIAGKIVAGALRQLQQLVEQKTTLTMIQLNELTEQYIVERGASPTFKNYPKKGSANFPAGVCISINQELVHGIPDNRTLSEGDVVSFDLGATYQGAIADSALTCIYGQPKNSTHLKLIQVTEESLKQGIGAIKIGARLGVIGNAIYKYARSQGFSVITQYGGHGISWNKAHASPFVSNRAEINEGIRIVPNMTIAIEPLLVIGSSNRTQTNADDWTVVCDNICSHVEHSIYVHENGVEIITDRSQL